MDRTDVDGALAELSGQTTDDDARPDGVPLAELEHALGVARTLATGADARRHVCAAARTATGAQWAALVERELGQWQLSAVEGLSASAAQQALQQDAGTIERQRIMRGRETVGLLLVGWERAAAPLAPAPRQLLELLALNLAFAGERDELVARLAGEARTDQLTGLANRRAWDEIAPRELGRAARHGLSATLALLDVDDLKRLNDTQGHAAGDALLRAVAARWRTQIRDADLLARVGGDEFALLLVPSQEESGPAVVERLVDGLPGGATCSVGVVAADGERDLPRLLERADAALYRAKAGGKGRVVAAPRRHAGRP